jgi:cytochrome c-type biogenesis protein CcmE
MTPTTQKRLFAVGAILVAASALAYISFGKMGDNLVYYLTPSELLAKGASATGSTVRLGGVVAPGSVKWDAKTLDLTFSVSDGTPGSPTVLVKSTGAPPQMFRESIGCVVEGTIDEHQVFHSDRVMVKHSNEYRAPKPGEKPKAGTLLTAAEPK